MQKALLFISLTLLVVSFASTLSAEGRRCGAPKLSKAEISSNIAALDFFSGMQNDNATITTSPEVSVYVFVVADSDGDVSATAGQINQQISILNDAWQGQFTFVLAGLQTIASSYPNVMFGTDAELEMKSNREGSADDLNLYVVDTSENGSAPQLLGYASYPSDYFFAPMNDSVVIDFRTLPNGQLEGYNEGDTGTHEVGHWLGLFHTFQGRCSATNDGVSDTPCSRVENVTCSRTDTCKKRDANGRIIPNHRGKDPIYNFMNYTPDTCMREFTPGQFSKMLAAWALYREGQ